VSFWLEGVSWCIYSYDKKNDWYWYREYKVEGLKPRLKSFLPDNFEKYVTSGDELNYARLMFGDERAMAEQVG
ncbi:MAG: hypothetical protein ACXABY_32855, partial [Candidatus Thorarchaeota archaeon]